MRYLSIQGDHYTCGRAVGRFFRANIPYRLRLFGITDAHVAKKRKAIDARLRACQEKYPALISELHGIADGSGIDFLKIFVLNAPNLWPVIHGCTSIAAESEEGVVLAHNEDGEKGERKHDTALIRFSYPHVTFHAFVYAGELAGSAYAWNEHGFFFSGNNIHPNQKRLFGISFFVSRLLVEAKTVAEALWTLKATEDPCCYHYFLGEKKRILSVELMGKKFSSFEIRSRALHTNHFTHLLFADADRKTKSSEYRFRRVAELLSQNVPLEKVLFDTKNRPHCIYNRKKDHKITLSTVIFDPARKKVRIYAKAGAKSCHEFPL